MTDPVVTGIEDLLRQHRGVIIGDNHTRRAIPEWIGANLPDLVERANVRVVFLEFFEVMDQPTIDGYLRGDSVAEQRLQTLADNYYSAIHPGAPIMRILESAREAGIRVVAIEQRSDHPESTAAPNESDLEVIQRLGRDRMLNTAIDWKNTIQNETASLASGETYLVMMGMGHTRPQDPSIGLDAALGIPSVDMYDDGQWTDTNSFGGFSSEVPLDTPVPSLIETRDGESDFRAVIPVSGDQGLPIPGFPIMRLPVEAQQRFIGLQQLVVDSDGSCGLADVQAIRGIQLDALRDITTRPDNSIDPATLGNLEAAPCLDASEVRAFIDRQTQR